MQGFEVVGKQFSRMSSAHGGCWNSYVRKRERSTIESAKAYIKQLKNSVSSGK